MGFGFVEFMTKQDAQKAIISLQGFALEGHSLQLKLSQKSASSKTQSKAPKKESGDLIEKKGTKLVVRNVPFEATRKELQQLFG